MAETLVTYGPVVAAACLVLALLAQLHTKPSRG